MQKSKENIKLGINKYIMPKIFHNMHYPTLKNTKGKKLHILIDGSQKKRHDMDKKKNKQKIRN